MEEGRKIVAVNTRGTGRLTLHQAFDLIPQTPCANIHFLWTAIAHYGHALDVDEPTGAGAPLGVTDVVS